MADVAYRLKIEGRLYELPQLTLGQARILRKHFDVLDITEMNGGDPSIIAGLAYLCISSANPDWEHARLMNYVDDLPIDTFEGADDEPSEDPNAEAANAGG